MNDLHSIYLSSQSKKDENNLSFKEKTKRYKTHLKPVRMSTCIGVTIILFVFLLFFPINFSVNSINKTVDASLTISANNSSNKLTAAFAGDIMIGRAISTYAEANGYDSLFEPTIPLFQDCDYVNGNFENPIIDEPSEYTKADQRIHLNALSQGIPALKKSPFTILGLSNNHISDYSKEGLINTLRIMDENNINYVGAGEYFEETISYNITTVDDLKIATLAISNIAKNPPSSDKIAGTLRTSYEPYLDLVKEASQKSDITIVNMHWGDEYVKGPNKTQKEIGKQLIDNGADIIIGAHPHVLQPVEIYNDGIIFYSLGNFIFDQGWSRTKDSVIVKYIISENNEKMFEIVPLRIENGTPSETSNPLFTSRIFRTLSKLLPSENYEIKDNRLYIYK